MKELLFSNEHHTLQENALGFAEVSAISGTLSMVGFKLSKLTQPPLPKNEHISQAQFAVYLFVIVFLCGYGGAMIGAVDENKPGSATHRSELLGCFLGSMFGVALDLAMLTDIHKNVLKQEAKKKNIQINRLQPLPV